MNIQVRRFLCVPGLPTSIAHSQRALTARACTLAIPLPNTRPSS